MSKVYEALKRAEAEKKRREAEREQQPSIREETPLSPAAESTADYGDTDTSSAANGNGEAVPSSFLVDAAEEGIAQETESLAETIANGENGLLHPLMSDVEEQYQRLFYVKHEEDALSPVDTSSLPVRVEKMLEKTLGPGETESPGQQSPVSPLRSTKKFREGKSIVIQPDDFIAREVLNRYGTYNALAFDLIKELNPHIQDLDRINPGQTVWLPPLTQDTLLKKQADESYSLILATFLTQKQAQEFAQTARSQGYKVRIIPHRLSANLLVQRVEIVGLQDLSQLERAMKLVRIDQSLFPLPPSSFASSASADG